MKPEQRQQQIMAQLRALQAELSVEELARKFAVSALTIRRDLERLELDGAILRTHGGCFLRGTVESAYHRKADHTKVGANAHAVYGRLSGFDVWYTTSGINPVQLRRFNQQTVVKVVQP